MRAMRSFTLLPAAALMAGGLCFHSATHAAASAATSPADIVTGAWQHHKLTFEYYGITTLYNCDGLQTRVRQLLLHLGARKDATVNTGGCPGGPDTPSHFAWVDVDFYSLAPVAEGAGTETVKAQWGPLKVTPQLPSFMGDGDCELIQSMKDVIIKNFSLRDLEYRTDCFPHEIWLNGFAVKGQALRALPQDPSAVKS